MSPLRATLFLACVAAVGCAADPASSSDVVPGGKADQLEDLELRCSVVEVIDDNVLEEGLGSIYDFDDEGFPMADGDSIEVDYRFSDLSEHESGRLLSIGQLTIGLHSADDEIRELDEAPEFNDETGFLSVEGRRADSNRIFKVRVFSRFMVGLVTYRAADVEACKSGATESCEFEDTPEAVAECEQDFAADCERSHELAKIDCRGVETPFDI